MKKALISFVGTNDKGVDLKGKKFDGAILTVLKERKFDFLHLIYNPTKAGASNFYDIAINVRDNAVKRKRFNKAEIILHSFECENVTDHNEIYPKLLELCRSLPKGLEYTAAIASGTPAMQVCWILISESGDFPLKLIRSNEPKFGKPLVTEVKLGTKLPRIEKLEKENKLMRKEIIKTLFPVNVYTKLVKVEIDSNILNLSNIEFCYYFYFLSRAYFNKPGLQVANNKPNDEFISSINNYFKKFFPDLERHNSDKTSFQSNISRINQKIKNVLGDNIATEFYKIQSSGLKGRKEYSIGLKPVLIKIK